VTDHCPDIIVPDYRHYNYILYRICSDHDLTNPKVAIPVMPILYVAIIDDSLLYTHLTVHESKVF